MMGHHEAVEMGWGPYQEELRYTKKVNFTLMFNFARTTLSEAGQRTKVFDIHQHVISSQKKKKKKTGF